MKMYTQEGTEVSVVKKIEEGYLAKIIYYTGFDDDNYDEEAESVCEQITFYESLFEKPPTEKFAKTVRELKDESERLTTKISELKQIKSEEEHLLNKISKYPIIKQLADYLTGNFQFVLYLSSMKIKKRESVYISSFIRTSNTKTEPFALYELRNDYYISDSDDNPFMVFEKEHEAQSEAKRRLINKFKNADFNYNKVNNLKDWFSKIDNSCLAKKGEDFLSIYNSKLKIWEAEENKRKEERLKKDIEELAKKQKQLQDLQGVV